MKSAPGPTGRKFSGNLAEYESDRLGFIQHATREFGDVWSFDRHVVVAAAPEPAGDVLMRTNTDFGPDRNFLHRKLREDRRLQEQWAHSRASRMRGMRPSAMNRKVPMLATGIHRQLLEWSAGRELDVVPAMRLLTSRLGALVCFGAEDAARLEGAEQELFWALLPVVASPVTLPEWIPLPRHRRVARANRMLEKRILGLLAGRRAKPQPAREEDLLDVLMTPTSRAGALDDKLISDTLIATMLAAQGAPAPGMAWVLHLLAEHPDVQHRLAQEAQAVLPDDGQLTSDHVGALIYTEWVVKETLRLWPPNWLLGRQVLRPTTVGGYTVRPGMMVMVAPYAWQRDRRWFSEPDRFDPERWTPGGEAESAHRFAYLPFGAGPLICMGMAWSMVEMTLLTGMLVRRFQVLSMGSTITPDPARELTPSGLRLKLAPRQVPADGTAMGIADPASR